MRAVNSLDSLSRVFQAFAFQAFDSVSTDSRGALASPRRRKTSGATSLPPQQQRQLPRLALPTPDRERLAAHSCTSWRWSDELLLILAHVLLALALVLAELARALRHRAHTTQRQHSPCGRGPLQQAPRVSIRVSKKEAPKECGQNARQELQVEKCRCAARVY